MSKRYNYARAALGPRNSKPDRKKVRNATKSTYNGIKFDSKLEVYTYKKLLEAHIDDFKYAEEEYILLEKIVYPEGCYSVSTSTKEITKDSEIIRPMKYTPDFTCVDHTNKTGWILEVKGYSNESFPLRWKLFKHSLVNNGYNITLYLPRTQATVDQVVNLIKDKYYDNTTVV